MLEAEEWEALAITVWKILCSGPPRGVTQVTGESPDEPLGSLPAPGLCDALSITSLSHF